MNKIYVELPAKEAINKIDSLRKLNNCFKVQREWSGRDRLDLYLAPGEPMHVIDWKQEDGTYKAYFLQNWEDFYNEAKE